MYERRGLLEPSGSPGGTRLCSDNDVNRLNRVTELLADGLNLAGVAMVLDLQDDNTPAERAGRPPRSAKPGSEAEDAR